MSQRLQPKRVLGPARAFALTLCSYVVILGTTVGSVVAVAQEAPATPETPAQGSTLEQVVVTGSRIERSTFNTPNPVTVLSSKDTDNLGLVNVGDVLAELPQNSNFFAANNVGLGNFNVGAQLANLRGLNPFFGTRTLTMIDTERVVSQATGGGVDVTLIPSMLVARTEVVTGGASAVYGSDAVAGVVNFILDKKLDGFKGSTRIRRTSASARRCATGASRSTGCSRTPCMPGLRRRAPPPPYRPTGNRITSLGPMRRSPTRA
jgi:iron complex outermembrane receptor protein